MQKEHERELVRALLAFQSAAVELSAAWDRATTVDASDRMVTLAAYPRNWGSFDEETADIVGFVAASVAMLEGGRK